nr:hypothetical protein [Tanacetum cinerariifolium]
MNNQLKQQYGNFKAKGSDILEQTFNRLQAIVSHLEFMDVEIEQDDLNQKFLTSLAPEWLMYTIVWRNRDDLDTISLDDVYNHLKVYEPKVQKNSESNSQNMAFISSANTSSGKGKVHTASILTASTQVSTASVDVAAASISHDTTGKKITIQGTDVAGFENSKVECFNCHKMGHFARECRAPRIQDKGRRESYKQGSKEEEPAPKALIAIDEIGWDWSYMTNKEENHALVADDEAPTEFALMAKSSSSSKNEIRGLKLDVEFKNNKIEYLMNELEQVKKEKEGLDSKLTGFKFALKDLDTLLGSQRTDKNKEGLGYSVVPPFLLNNSSEHGESSSSIMSKPMIKFVKAADSPTVIKTNKVETARKSPVKYAEMYRNTSKSTKVRGYWDSSYSRHMTGNISYLSEYEPYDGGYVSFGQGGGKITGKDFKLKDDTNVLLRTHRQHNMYSIDLNNIVSHKNLICLVAKASTDESMLWHRRLGHLNFKTMNKLVRHNLVKGLASKCFENDHICVACLKGKQHKESCKTKLVNSVSKSLHTLHMDLFGPTSVSSLNHKWYCLVVTVDFSRFTWTFFLRTKDETSSILRNFIKMNEFYTRKGIKREFNNARTPQQNGVAEKRNRTLIEATRIMLADAKLPATFWAEAVNTACYVQNRVLDVASQAVKKDVSSLRNIALPNWFHEAHLESSNSDAQDACNSDVTKSSGISNPTATSKIPQVDQMEILTVESVIPTVSLSVLTACLDNSLETSSDSRLISKGVISQEQTLSLDNILTLSNRFKDILGDTTNTVDTNGVEADLSNMESIIPASPTPTFRIHKDHPKSQIIGPVDTSVQTRNKSKEMEEHNFIATIHQKTNLDLLQFYLFSYFLSQEEPKKIFDALKDPMAQGYTREEGIDYEEVFAPVARIEAIRLFLAYASFMGFIVYQMDVRNAFLYGTIDDEVYVMQPLGFQDPEFPDRVYKVEKAMYGLHQAPRAWYGTLSKYLLANGFQRGTIDQTLYIRKHKGDFLLVQVYVDDIIFGSSNLLLCREFEALMHDKFQMSAIDSDYGGATQDRKSTTGGCQFLGRRLISWQWKKQTIMVTSTTKAEYVAASSGCRQVLWIQNQLLDYGLTFYDYHNMIAILEKIEHSNDFYQIVDFLEASHIRYALTINPTVSVLHIRQFWSTTRIETTNEGTKILATVDGKLRTISESSIRRNLKLNDEEGISSLPNAELFENLALMGYNILPNQNFTFQKGQFSHKWKVYNFSKMIFDGMGEGLGTPTEPRHTPSLQEQQSSHHDPSSPSHLTATTESIPTAIPIEIPTLRQYSRRATRIAYLQKQQTEMATKIKDQDLEISGLKARVKILEDKDRGSAEPSRDDAPIKGRSIEIGEEVGVERSIELGSNDTKEMVNVLTFIEVANILTSEVAAISVPPVVGVSTAGVPTVNGLFPTVSAIFATASVVTPYSRRTRGISAKDKGKEKVVESEEPKKKKLQEQIDAQVAIEMEEEIAREDQRMNEQLARNAEIARIHAKEELKMLIDGLDKSNEVIAKHLQEYEQSEAELTIGENIELINELVKYQDHHTKHFRGMTLEEIKEKFIPVRKQIEDFVPRSSTEEGKRMKRKGLKLDERSAKRMKASKDEEELKGMMQLVPVKEVYVKALQVKHPIIDWEIHSEGKKDYWKIIRLGGHTSVYQFFVDMLK